MSDLPLTGVRVLDCAPTALGAIGRFLGELGAEVVRVDAGEAEAGPKVAGVSLHSVAAHLGKRVVVRPPREELAGLIREADILLSAPVRPELVEGLPFSLVSGEKEGSASTSSARTGREVLNPRLLHVRISDFGETGPWAAWRASDAVLHALTGGLSRSGLPGREPLIPPGRLTYETAAAQIAYQTLAAFLHCLRTGEGDRLDVSLIEAGMQALDPGFGLSGSAQSGVPFWKMARGRMDERFRYPIVPCADGHVRACILAPRQWRGMWRWMGEPAEFAGPEWDKLQTRFRSPDLVPAIARFFADKTRAEIEAEAEAHGVPAAALLDLEEAVATEHMVARHAFAEVEIASGVTLPFPNGAIEIDGERTGIRPAPADAARFTGERIAFASPPTADRPLVGLKVLDMGVIVVGGETGRLLADLGADVVKVENGAFPDGQRQSRDDAPVSLTFAAGHRNKRGLSIDLRSDEGRALFLDLVREADVLLSNFKPGTLASLGLSREDLAAANPRLVTVDSSAFGPTGPWSRRLGYGPLVRCSAGLAKRWVYPNEPQGFADFVTVYPDHVAARIGACGALALLIRRMRTGGGGSASVAQAEVMLGHMAADIAAEAAAARGLTVEPAQPAEDWLLPADGDDEWVVATVTSADRARLAALCGGGDRASVAAWVAARAPADAATALQEVGVAAGWMVRVIELPDLPHYQALGTFREATHPLIDHPFTVETGLRTARIPPPDQRPAPRIGEQSLAVVRDWLGRDAHDLATRGIIEQAA